MQLSLAGQTVLVTGGGSGIGKGVAAAVVAAGGNAMLVGRNADRLSAAADEIRAQGGPGSVLYEPADVTNEDEVTRAVEAATAWTRPVVWRRALRRRQRDHRAGHPDRFRGMAANCRPEHQRHHVRAQARCAGDGSRWRRIVHRHFVDRGEQYAPVVRCLRGLEGGHRSSDAAGGRRTRRVVGPGELHPAGPDPHRTRCAGS